MAIHNAVHNTQRAINYIFLYTHDHQYAPVEVPEVEVDHVAQGLDPVADVLDMERLDLRRRVSRALAVLQWPMGQRSV